MASELPESDWRLFKKVRQNLLERYSRQILEEVMAASRGTAGTAHDRYLKVYKLIRDRDKQMGRVFDDFRRSTAVRQLGIIRGMKLLTDEELSAFSEQTQIRVEGIASL